MCAHAKPIQRTKVVIMQLAENACDPTELCFNHWSVERDINDKRLDEPRELKQPSCQAHQNMKTRGG